MDPEDTYSAYQAPGVDHLDEGPEPYQPTMFSLRGRIGRARFVAYTWWGTFLMALFCGFLMAILGGLLVGFGSSSAGMSTFQQTFMFPWMFAVGALTYVPTMIMAKRRLNDLNVSGWFAIMIFVPLVNVLLFLYLLLWPGQEAVNRYGPPAVQNSLPVWLLGVGLPLLLLMMLVAALLMPLFTSEALWAQPEFSAGP